MSGDAVQVPLGTRLRRHLDRWRRKRGFRALEAEFDLAIRDAGEGICIDLGANVGEFSRKMAAHGARVYAFEPDPWTVARLRENCADLPGVEVIEAAAGAREGVIRLLRAPGFGSNPGRKSKSSSVVAAKKNVSDADSIDVRVVDFPAFLQSLDADVDVIKMDIEGAEVELLEALLDHPVLSRIGRIYVETHETTVPALADRSEALRARCRSIARPRINMDWK